QEGMTCSYAGEHGQAQEFLRHAIATGDVLGVEGRSHVSIVAETVARAEIVRTLAECGLFEEAVRLGGEAIRIAEDLDSPINKIIAYLTLGEAHEVKGEFACAIPLLERALAEVQAWDLNLTTPAVTAALGYALAKSGRVADGVALLEQISRVYESPAMPASRSRSVVTLGEICLAADRLDEAAALGTRAVALSHESGQRGWEAGALRLLAEIASRRRPADVAMVEAHYRAALAIAEDLGMQPLVARCHLGLSSVCKHPPGEAVDH